MANKPVRAPIRVDARGMRCPWPALRAARAMREADAIVLLADDPRAGNELAALAGENGWVLQGGEDARSFIITRGIVGDSGA